MVKRPLEEETGQNLDSICRAVKRLHTSSGTTSQQIPGSAALEAGPDHLAGLHPGAGPQQQSTAAGGMLLLPNGQLTAVGTARPSWSGAGPGAAGAASDAQQYELQPGYQSIHLRGADTPAMQHAGHHQQGALHEQLRQQKLLHEQQYLARQQHAQQQQQQHQHVQQHMQQHMHHQQGMRQQGDSPDYVGPSTPRQAEDEHTPAALLARQCLAYEAPNTLLKELHFERLRRLTLSDDGGPGSASQWRFQ